MVVTYLLWSFQQKRLIGASPTRVVWCPENGVSLSDDIMDVKILQMFIYLRPKFTQKLLPYRRGHLHQIELTNLAGNWRMLTKGAQT
jgi:hypothetical protein